MIDTARMKIEGRVIIRDAITRELLVDQHNDIHKENFSEAVALSLANFDRGVIEEMHFGNGGSSVDSTGAITYGAPHITGQGATLYNETYIKVVNDRSARFTSDAVKVNIKANHTTGALYTDIIVTCTLGYSEPSDQDVFDNSTIMDGKYIFDELGLFSYDSDANVRRLLTHVVFHPVQKALNRAIEVVYTVRITMM